MINTVHGSMSVRDALKKGLIDSQTAKELQLKESQLDN